MYMPHSGFSHAELLHCYCELGQIMQAKSKAGRHMLIGGDFNAQLRVGARGELLPCFAA